ncbi:hypothetical protein KEM55_002815 [Ascosphaera atra]|nr:hypothetical protein KEM55_002815 [Ascosphaera atra]
MAEESLPRAYRTQNDSPAHQDSRDSANVSILKTELGSSSAGNAAPTAQSTGVPASASGSASVPDPNSPSSVARSGPASASPDPVHHGAQAKRKPFSLAGGKQITRSRISYSCHTCRRRKVKCDKIHPTCSNCIKTGGICTYDVAASSGPFAPRKQQSQPPSQPQHSRSASSPTASTPFEQNPEYDNGRSAKRLRNDSVPYSHDNSYAPERPNFTPVPVPSREDGPIAEDTARRKRKAFLREQGAALGLGPRDVSAQEIAARLDRLNSLVERWSQTDGLRWLRDLDQAIQGQHDTEHEREREVEREHGHTVRRDVRHSSIPRKQQSQERQQHQQQGIDTASKSQSGEANNERRSEGNGEPDFPVPEHDTELVDPVASLNLGHLSVEGGGKSRYVGTTYWAYVSHEISELNQLLRDQYRTRESPAIVAGGTPDSPAISRDGGPSVANVSPQSGRSTSRKHSLHRSMLFATGDSPVPDNQVEVQMLQNVPSKRQSHILYKGFMSGIHAIAPVLHPPTVLEQYSAFWEWYEDQQWRWHDRPFPCPSFIPLLYAIWYGGTVTVSLRTLSSEFDVESRDTLSMKYYDEVTRWLKKIGFPRNPTFYGLSAFLLVQTILSKEEEPLTTSLFVSLSLRVAQTMGLHRDPSHFKAISATEAESRRRVWWHIVHMDGVVAMSSGLPPLLNDEDFWDVRMTSEVKDILIGTSGAKEYEDAVASRRRRADNPDDAGLCGGPSMVNVYYLCCKGKYIMAKASRAILRIQLGTKPITRSDMEELRNILVNLQSELRRLVDRIPISPVPRPLPGGDYLTENPRKMLYNRPPASVVSTASTPSKCDLANGGPGCLEQFHNPVLPAFHKWARILLLLFVDKAFCVAYQPFLKNAKSQVWPAARQGALRHCHSYMEKFIMLATDPDFQPFQWSWPGNHQPMHATMIMLIDLYERPHSPEAFKSRAYIDKIFSLSGPDGGVVGDEDGISTARPLRDGGREAWDMLKRLRQKAWLKAGLDPELLWTEQAQERARIWNTAGRYMFPPRPAATTTAAAPQAMPAPVSRSNQRSSISVPTSFADDYLDMMSPSTPSLSRDSGHRKAAAYAANQEMIGQAADADAMHRRHVASLQPPPSAAPAVGNGYSAGYDRRNSPQASIGSLITNNLDAQRPNNGSLLRPNASSSPPGRDMATLLNPVVDPTVVTTTPAHPTQPVTSLFTPPAVPQAPSTLPQISTAPVPLASSSPANAAMAAIPDPMAAAAAAAAAPAPAPAAPAPADPSLFPKDVDMTFDWDEWSAVFGQDLPVVDAYMDLDMIINPITTNNLPSADDAAIGSGLNEAPANTAAGGGVNGGAYNSPGEFGGMGKWADFG